MARNPSPLETAPPRQGPALPLPPEPCRLPRRPRTARLPTAGFAALEKKNKLWIWLAFDRSGQRLIDWECGGRDAATLNRLLERLKPWSCTVQMIMGLTTPSCRLGGTISARMKRWQLSGSIAGYVIGLPAFGLCGVESARDGRRHHRTVCRLPRQSNSDKTHLATICLIPSLRILEG